MEFEVTIEFPKQVKDFKRASRMVRKTKVFKEFVTYVSKDRRVIILNFKDQKRYDILKPILLSVLKSEGYESKVLEE